MGQITTLADERLASSVAHIEEIVGGEIGSPDATPVGVDRVEIPRRECKEQFRIEPAGAFELQESALQVLAWYADRWSVEVAFHDAKQSRGFEEVQSWSRRAVERTAPMAMLLYDVIVRWFVESGRRVHRSLDRPWYKTAKRLRRESLREEVFAWAGRPSHQERILDLLEHASNLAA